MNIRFTFLYKLFFCTFLLLGNFLGSNAQAESDSEEKLTVHLALLSALAKTERQLEYQKLEAEMQDRLDEIETQNASILARLEVRDSDVGNYIDAISWVSGIVIGFVGILFGIGAFILYRENQDVATKTKAQLDASNEQTANIQSSFDDWFNDARKEYARELDLMARIMRLRNLLDQPSPAVDEIYPEVSPLFANPKLEYLPIFRKILSLDLSTEIKRNTETAIKQIKQSTMSNS